MKTYTSFIAISVIGFFAVVVFSSMIIKDPQPQSCQVEKKKITSVEEGTSFDIVLKDSQGERYYINRGLQRGLNLAFLNSKVLNKTVTLHLAKVLGGIVTSEHISQLSVEGNIIFTEFN